MEKNIVWSKIAAHSSLRESLLNQKGCVVWLTGLPGSGKSTIAAQLENNLISQGKIAFVLDGDNLRHGLCNDLSFSENDRHENIRRLSEVAKLFADCGVIIITAFISPYEIDRNLARSTIGAHRFIETYVNTPAEVCEKRDPKGLWKRARSGEIKDFTGIDAPFDIPSNPDITINTLLETPIESVEQIINFLHHFLFY